MALWSKNILKDITNKLGQILLRDKDYDSKENKCIAWVMVEINLSEGLQVDMEIY